MWPLHKNETKKKFYMFSIHKIFLHTFWSRHGWIYLINTTDAKSAVQTPQYASPLDIGLTISPCLSHILPRICSQGFILPKFKVYQEHRFISTCHRIQQDPPDAEAPGVCPVHVGFRGHHFTTWRKILLLSVSLTMIFSPQTSVHFFLKTSRCINKSQHSKDTINSCL